VFLERYVNKFFIFKNKALFIEDEIEKHLGIKDRYVPGGIYK